VPQEIPYIEFKYVYADIGLCNTVTGVELARKERYKTYIPVRGRNFFLAKLVALVHILEQDKLR